MGKPVLFHRDGPVLIITLNDPKRANPLSPAMVAALSEALEIAAEDDGIRAFVLHGAGKHFSAGADLAALQQIASGGDVSQNRADSERLSEFFARLLDHPKLSIAAVHGAAVAGGCGLATACDFVIADETVKMCYTEVKIGFIPALVSTFLTRRVAGHHARKLMLDPEMLGATEALAIGLIDRVVDGDVLEQAAARAHAIARKASPSALAATKRLLNQTVGMDWKAALAVAAEANVVQRLHPECQRGVQSFLDTKKTPDWLVRNDE